MVPLNSIFCAIDTKPSAFKFKQFMSVALENARLFSVGNFKKIFEQRADIERQ